MASSGLRLCGEPRHQFYARASYRQTGTDQVRMKIGEIAQRTVRPGGVYIVESPATHRFENVTGVANISLKGDHDFME